MFISKTLLLICFLSVLISVYGYNGDPRLAAIEAGRYLYENRDEWHQFRPRALIALSFLKEYLVIPEDDQKAMVDQLNRQLLFEMKRSAGVLPLQMLAVHTNAQLATCQNPRNFSGIDLIELMRSDVDQPMKMNTVQPIVILSLCLSKDTRLQDTDKLIQIYDSNPDIAITALTIVAMATCREQMTKHQYQMVKARVEDFLQRTTTASNVYIRSLIIQALNAWGYDASAEIKELTRHQSPDGAFDGLLATYVAIPALLNKSLAEIQCKGLHYTPRRSTAIQLLKPDRGLLYTISIPFGENEGNHSIKISYNGRKSFYELMIDAWNRNPLYAFECDETAAGKKVIALAGISNDAETSLLWTLYREKDSMQVKETNHVDYVYPQDGEHLIFQLQYNER